MYDGAVAGTRGYDLIWCIAHATVVHMRDADVEQVAGGSPVDMPIHGIMASSMRV